MGLLIIVGTDFSETALQAVREAQRLGLALDAVLEVIHVREGLRSGPLEVTPSRQAWLDAAGLSPESVVLTSGTPWVELVRRAMERNADLLVAGTHGCTGFQPMALGSNAQRLALLAPRPVVLVGLRAADRSTAPFAPASPEPHVSRRISR